MNADAEALTVGQMREADRRAIEDFGIPSAVLMDRAGAAIYRELPPGPIGIVCGKGNNGGDGFVVAQYALLAGRDVRVVLLGARDEVRGDAAIFLKVCLRLGVPIESVTTEEETRAAVAAMADCACVVDAMLGTGFEGEVRGAFRSAIEAWPSVHTVSADIPSGLNADTGAASGPCVKADTTVTMQFLKTGFANPAARKYLGKVVVADIGIPPLDRPVS